MKIVYISKDVIPISPESLNRGAQLKFAREYRNISQSKLSKDIEGLSQSNLSKYEKGFGYISNDLLIKCMEYLKFPFEWLDRPCSRIKFL